MASPPLTQLLLPIVPEMEDLPADEAGTTDSQGSSTSERSWVEIGGVWGEAEAGHHVGMTLRDD